MAGVLGVAWPLHPLLACSWTSSRELSNRIQMSSAAGSSPGCQEANAQSHPREGMQCRGMDGSALSQRCPEPTQMSPHRAAALKHCLKHQGGKIQSAFYIKRKEKLESNSLLLKFHLCRINSNKCFGVFVREWPLRLSMLFIYMSFFAKIKPQRK